MPAYLVRLIDTRDLVGFFFAEGVDHLDVIVDECIDVPDCEYVELPEGGIMWESPAIDVPIEIDKDSVEADENDIPDVPWSAACLRKVAGACFTDTQTSSGPVSSRKIR